MSEQNRRAVEIEPLTPPHPKAPSAHATSQRGPDDGRALGPDADERQTQRQAPGGAAPGESAEDDTIG